MKTKKEIEKVEKLIEAGEYGEIDYQWNGKKILKDNIKFKRNEFFELLGIAIQSKEKEMLKKINGFLEENKVDNRKEFCYKFTSKDWNTFLHKEELHPNWLIKQKLKGAEK